MALSNPIETPPVPWPKRLKRAAAGSRLFSAFVTMLERLGDHRPNLLRVLTYHRIDEPDAQPDLDPALISATPAAFDRQMELLSSRYRVVSMPQVLEARRSGKELAPRSVLVTFDDACTDFEANAWPILKKHKVPATLFVPTAYPGQPERVFWWDRLHRALRHTSRQQVGCFDWGPLPVQSASQRAAAARRIRGRLKELPHEEAMSALDDICGQLGDCPAPNGVLSWDALRRLSADGVTLGAHTQTHPLMNRVPLDEARREAVDSLNDLKREIGDVSPVFAYPAGGCEGNVARMLEAEGFELAFTTRRGVHDLARSDPLTIRRINVGFRSTPTALRAQLLPSMRFLHPWLK